MFLAATVNGQERDAVCLYKVHGNQEHLEASQAFAEADGIDTLF